MWLVKPGIMVVHNSVSVRMELQASIGVMTGKYVLFYIIAKLIYHSCRFHCQKKPNLFFLEMCWIVFHQSCVSVPVHSYILTFHSV